MTKEILYNQKDLVTQTKVTAYLDSSGKPWLDEHMARYVSCTHMICDKCGKPHLKNAWCEPCRDRELKAKYKAMPELEWDGESPIAIYNEDQYFFDAHDLIDYCIERDIHPLELNLVSTKPAKFRELDEDYFIEEIGEDAYLPDEAEELIDKLNKVLSESESKYVYQSNKSIVLGNDFIDKYREIKRDYE